jgi:hypothetical protein
MRAVVTKEEDMADLEQVLRALYEDPALREDMNDDEANALLTWAEAQLPTLVANAPDDAAFEERTQAFKTLLTAINRYIGLSSYAPSDETQAALNEALAAAPDAGLSLDPAAGLSAQSAAPLSGVEAVNALTAALRPATPSADTPVISPDDDPQPADWSAAFNEDGL